MTAGDVTAKVRSLLDEDLATPEVYTDARLLPFVDSAHKILQKDLAAAGIEVNAVQVDLPLLSGATKIDGATAPPLPAGFVLPIKLWEKPTVGVIRFTEMGPVSYGLPDVAQGSLNEVWQFREEAIHLIGATQAVTVRLRFEKELDAITAAAGELKIRGGFMAIVFKTAALAARSRGVADLTADLNAEYEQEKAKLIPGYVAASQKKREKSEAGR